MTSTHDLINPTKRISDAVVTLWNLRCDYRIAAAKGDSETHERLLEQFDTLYNSRFISNQDRLAVNAIIRATV